jgi:hypothetical protein
MKPEERPTNQGQGHPGAAPPKRGDLVILLTPFDKEMRQSTKIGRRWSAQPRQNTVAVTWFWT